MLIPHKRLSAPSEPSGLSDHIGLFMILAFAGIALAIVGATMLLANSTGEPRVTGGAVIIIGPIPIVFGSGPDVLLLLPLAIVLTVIVAALFLLGLRRFQ